jgi:hypothetical protein
MLIGDQVIYQGKAYILVGFTPMSVSPAEVQLCPIGGGEPFWVEWQDLWPPIAPERAAFHVHPRSPGGRRRRKL